MGLLYGDGAGMLGSALDLSEVEESECVRWDVVGPEREEGPMIGVGCRSMYGCVDRVGEGFGESSACVVGEGE